jgi:hypothetical protein
VCGRSRVTLEQGVRNGTGETERRRETSRGIVVLIVPTKARNP